MKIFFAGSEIPSHRKVLRETGAKNAALSYMGLRRRIKHPNNWLLADKFPEEAGLLLDSGAHTVNSNAADYTQRDLKELYESYMDFVALNIDRVDAFIEFDAMALGREWIEEKRALGASVSPDKFVPVWHPEWGVNYLQEMADNFQNIGIPTADLAGRNLVPVLNQIASKGVKLHGVGMTSMDDMREIRWHSVSSTSWVSPQQYGETHVWTGRELKRYPKKMKDQARKRYRTLFEREGFDAEKIEADDSTELLRLSIWSWETFVADIEKKASRHLQVATTHPETGDDGFAEVDGLEVDTQTGEVRNPVSTLPVPRERPRTALPVLGSTKSVVKNEDGEDEEVTTYHVRSESDRRCDSCFLANKCPAFEPGANCAFNIPMEVRTRDEYTHTANSLVGIQLQRVLFMRYAEELEGGYADPNLSVEIDRLMKMIKTKNDMDSSFSVKFEAKGSGAGIAGGQGMLNRIFGDAVADKARELPAPIEVEQIMDVEFTDE